ncbi:O-antigen polymerase [Terriglobus sp. ADX1]|uniref:O-antigen polymerase n=1 Tax=Terriglobus sp. ADX1 TaxID=2794063 RepID=UPI002FE5A9C4
MFVALLIATGAIALIGTICALDGSHDIFHPLVLIGPMMAFLYTWMPWKLYMNGGLSRFFDSNQLLFIATLNLLGVAAFVGCCLSVGVRSVLRRNIRRRLSPSTAKRLLFGGSIAGSLGLLCWAITIVNVGGFVNAFSASYSGGWDDSGYIRDGSILLLLGVMTALLSRSAGGPRIPAYCMLAIFGVPWLASAILMARRGPTFELAVFVFMSWYVNRKKRPPVVALAVGGVCLGWLVLFLVTNRSSIYIGSNFDVNTDVSNIVEAPDTGNEWIYGGGTVLSSERRGHYFWMRRYLAQILVRPIPSSIWANKYEDFGIPELLHNAGTGEGFGDTLGWQGADGSAPGIVADLWVEVWWFAVPFMGVLGWFYGWVWKKSVTQGGYWISQAIVLNAISIYLVMQTMEAVIFRSLLLSIPSWLLWRYAAKRVTKQLDWRREDFSVAHSLRLRHVENIRDFEVGHANEI